VSAHDWFAQVKPFSEHQRTALNTSEIHRVAVRHRAETPNQRREFIMTTTHDDATTWRDLADQLTPEQIERLADMERRQAAEEPAETLLFGAREYAEQNLNDGLVFGGVDWPEGARKVYSCGERTDGRGWSREFSGTRRQVAGVSVYIDGTQFADGTVERELAIGVDDLSSGPGGRLTVDEARQLVALIADAADELERLR
jgi:hypothetical protein